MGLRKWLGKRGGDAEDEPVSEYSLTMMQPGFLVDYDLKTWQVTAKKLYDYDGFIATEWELHSGETALFLERSEDDGQVELTLTRPISLRSDIDEDVIGTVLDDDDPPETVHADGRAYAAIESSTGLQKEDDGAEDDDSSTAREFVSWTYESDDRRVLFVLRWGERDFSAYEGEYVEAYQFTDILPGTLQ